MPATRREFTEMCLRALALPAFAAWLDGEPQQYTPKFFNPKDFEALQSFTEILIPTDDTPGAREARCAQFIDFLLDASAEDPHSQSTWRKIMSSLRDVGFHHSGPDARAKLVAALAHQDHSTFHLIKRLNTFAFYTSRPGQIDALDYRGMSYNVTFPGCTHPEHKIV